MAYFEFWFLFPVGILIAILGMSSGISGSNFWIPVYIIWLKIEPKTGFWLALLTMIFGFGSGVIKNLRAGTYQWPLIQAYLKICIPMSILGGIFSAKAPVDILLAVFAVFVSGYGLFRISQFFFQSNKPATPHEKIRWSVGAIAGFLIGFVATGLGKLLLPTYTNHRLIKHHSEAIGTTVIIVFIVNLAALLSRMDATLVEILLQNQSFIISVMIWVAPGVLIGGQLGPKLSQKLPKKYLNIYIGALLLLVGGLIFLRVFS